MTSSVSEYVAMLEVLVIGHDISEGKHREET